MANHTGLFRVRRGLFGRSVLQECIDYPTFSGVQVDSSRRDLVWEDVPYNRAPRGLISQWGRTHDYLKGDGSSDGSANV